MARKWRREDLLYCTLGENTRKVGGGKKWCYSWIARYVPRASVQVVISVRLLLIPGPQPPQTFLVVFIYLYVPVYLIYSDFLTPFFTCNVPLYMPHEWAKTTFCIIRGTRGKSAERANPYSEYVLRIVPNLNIEVVSKPRGFKCGCCGRRGGRLQWSPPC